MDQALRLALHRIRESRPVNQDERVDGDGKLHRELRIAHERLLDEALGRARDQARTLNLPLPLALTQSIAEEWVRFKRRRGSSPSSKEKSWLPASARSLVSNLMELNNFKFIGRWQNVITVPDLYKPMLDIICDALNLEPRAQWWEALRVNFLPKVPERVDLFDWAKWKQLEDVFTSGAAGETDVYCAAWQLLFDAWLYLFGYYKSPDETIFSHLADLTRKFDAPPLRIAHCLRDLAYGDESRTADLISLVESQDPEYRSVLEACYWSTMPKDATKPVRKPKSSPVSKKKA